jgi:hypothetical protein
VVTNSEVGKRRCTLDEAKEMEDVLVALLVLGAIADRETRQLCKQRAVHKVAVE